MRRLKATDVHVSLFKQHCSKQNYLFIILLVLLRRHTFQAIRIGWLIVRPRYFHVVVSFINKDSLIYDRINSYLNLWALVVSCLIRIIYNIFGAKTFLFPIVDIVVNFFVYDPTENRFAHNRRQNAKNRFSKSLKN